VAWNADYEDMVCYSGNGYLNIKASQFPTHRQRMQGFVVGFMGSKIFCLTQSSVVAVDVPQAVTMDRLIAAKQFPQAYETACLGVTEDEWQRLAMSALENYQLETAKKAFAWLRDFKYLELIAYLESLKGLSAENGRNLCLAYYHAYLGQFKEVRVQFL
jgi:intraflagellar transport protein 122